MSIATGISAVKTGFDLVKGVVDLLKRSEVDANEVLARLIELQGLMLEARESLSEAKDEEDRLKKVIAEHNRTCDIQSDFQMHDSGFWTRKSENGKIGYCPVCWGANYRLVPLTPLDGAFRCEIHDVDYLIDEKL